MSFSWEDKIQEILENIEISEEFFRRRGSSDIHSKILEELENTWNESRPRLEERAFQIDFVGRTFARHGKIELAVEVDTWFTPTGNWVKLLDINSSNKIWIYVCREKDRANEFLERALKEFRKLADMRRETKENNVTIFMKTVNKKEIEKHHLFE